MSKAGMFSIQARFAALPRPIWPVLAGLAGSGFLAGLYFAIVSWAESPAHALDLFWQERWLVIPLILGFGVQAGLYTILRLRLFVPLPQGRMAGAGSAHGAAVTGAGGAASVSGASSTAAMIACCAHHVTDVLPVLGLTAAAAFLAEYQTEFMLFGLLSNLGGIGFMLAVLLRERRKAAAHAALCQMAPTD